MFALTAAAAPSNDGAALVAQMAEWQEVQLRGAATYVAESRTLAHGGPITFTLSSDTAYVNVDGVTAGKRVLRNVDNGNVAGPAQLAKLSNEPSPPLSRAGMRLPLLGGALSDYTFGQPQQRNGLTDVPFATRVKDEAHGDGILTLDLAQKRLAHIAYHPAVLPPRATSMSVAIDFARAFEGRWDVATITLTFTGRQAFINGGGTTVTQYLDYEPHPSAADALKALSEIATPPS
jgi:hypothetical protein